MFANPLVNQVVLLAFAGLLVAAAVEDIRRLLIPNRYCLAIALLYPLHVLASPQPIDWTGGLLAGGVLLATGFVLFALRLIGGGDAKLLAAASLWAGPGLLPEFILMTALFGGAIAGAMLMRRALASPARNGTAVSLARRIKTSITVFIGNMLVARQRVAGVAAAQAAPGGGATVSDTPPSGILPYGAAISAGGLLVAALLMMRG